MDTRVERARWRFTANRRVTEGLQLGVELNAAAEELNPLVTWFLFTETERRPSLFLGTSSDRIGSPAGTPAYYATVVKSLPELGASAYVSLNWSEWDDAFNVPFGASLDVGGRTALRYMFDGHESHALLDMDLGQVGVSLMWIWLEQPGVSFYSGF